MRHGTAGLAMGVLAIAVATEIAWIASLGIGTSYVIIQAVSGISYSTDINRTRHP